jgi:hypothetical protein
MTNSVQGTSALMRAFDAIDPEEFAALERSPLGVSLAVRQRSFEVFTHLRSHSVGFSKAFPPQDLEVYNSKVSGFVSADGPLEAHKRHQAGVERVVAKVRDERRAGRLSGSPEALIPELESLGATLREITQQTRAIANLLKVKESVAFLAAPKDLLQPVAVTVHQALKSAWDSGFADSAPDWFYSRPALPDLIDAVIEYWDPDVHGNELEEPLRLIHSVLIAWKGVALLVAQ